MCSCLQVDRVDTQSLVQQMDLNKSAATHQHLMPLVIALLHQSEPQRL